MKKMVLKLSINDEKAKRKALKVVAGVEGVDSVAVDMKEEKITVVGNADPVFLTAKLRKFGHTELLAVGPAKEEEKKEEKKPEGPAVMYQYVSTPTPYNYGYTSYASIPVVEHEPQGCTIC